MSLTSANVGDVIRDDVNGQAGTVTSMLNPGVALCDVPVGGNRAHIRHNVQFVLTRSHLVQAAE